MTRKGTRQKGATRATFLEQHIESRGVRDPLVLAAMRAVPRGLFVLPGTEAEAYEDRPLPIGEGQTISQPFIVAFMIEALALKGGEKVLEVGAGSGYAAAVLARIAARVFAIERVASLAELAQSNLAEAGIENVEVRHADGTKGWREEAPFDAILVSAGAPSVPRALQDQLAIGGRLVVPVGADPHAQTLVRVTRRSETDFTTEDLGAVRFVPLIGAHGWPDAAAD